MIRIPAGRWRVGSSGEEREALAERYGFHPSLLAGELEAKEVSLPEFFIDEYPVTNDQYAAFLQATGHMEPYDWTLRGTADRADHPVVGVGGDSAAAYAEWAGKRLPTPEEWEAAFHGLPPQPNRSRPAEDWTPITYPRTADPGPAGACGVHGVGQVTEWTSTTTQNGPFPFRMLKGAWWLCEEAWSLRVASGAFAFAPWCRQWTGLRCAADTDTGPAPTADLPQPGELPAPVGRDTNVDTLTMTYGGGQSVSVAFPGFVGEQLIAACPEGWGADGERLGGDGQEFSTSCPAGACTEATYRLAADGIELRPHFRAGRDYVDMDYALANSRGTPSSVVPSTCVNAGLLFPFYDFEGSRTWVWLGGGEWVRVRSLPRTSRCVRWISYVALPEPAKYPAAILVAVVARDGRHVFGYGRPGLTEPVRLANNMCFTCLHLDPVVTVAGGGTGTARARIYCMPGGLDDLRRRFVEDFGIRSRSLDS